MLLVASEIFYCTVFFGRRGGKETPQWKPSQARLATRRALLCKDVRPRGFGTLNGKKSRAFPQQNGPWTIRSCQK